MIYTISDVKLACNRTLRSAFPNVKVYDNDTLDGYQRPSFFTEIFSHGRTKTSKHLTQIGFTFRITYFEQIHDEAHCLEVRVKGRFRVVVRDIDYAWIDENADKLQVTISFYDAIELGNYSEDADIMRELSVEYESEV